VNASLAAIVSRLNDPNYLHAGQPFTEALARLNFAADHHLPLAVLLGASGTGKTALLRRFRRQRSVSSACIVGVQLAALSEAELRASVAQQIGIAPGSSWLTFVERLQELAYDQTPLIVLADDVKDGPASSLDFLARLWDADPAGQLRVSIVVALDELSLATWPEPWLRRVDLRIELQRWALEDATQFLTAVVGEEHKRQRGFEPAAIERLHELSQGLPRLLRRYAHLALLATEGQERTMVDEPTVMGATHELCGLGASHAMDGAAIEFLDDFLIT
jgi:type II secretory pathway predicted ATPase ExeA